MYLSIVCVFASHNQRDELWLQQLQWTKHPQNIRGRLKHSHVVTVIDLVVLVIARPWPWGHLSSNSFQPGWLFDIGDYMYYQLYMRIVKTNINDPYTVHQSEEFFHGNFCHKRFPPRNSMGISDLQKLWHFILNRAWTEQKFHK